MTQRELYAKTDRAGAAMGQGQFNKNKAQDFNDITKMTQRELYAKTDRAGSAMGQGQYEKNKAADYNDITKMTQRELYAKTDRAGASMGKAQYEQTRAVDWNDIPSIPQREIYAKTDRAGIINNSVYDRTRTRLDVENMLLNVSKENLSRGREPTTSNYNKGPIIDYTMVSTCDKTQVNRDLYPDNKFDSQKRMPSNYTRFPQRTPVDTWHFYTHVEENLRGNPYVNNVIHQSPQN